MAVEEASALGRAEVAAAAQAVAVLLAIARPMVFAVVGGLRVNALVDGKDLSCSLEQAVC